MIFFFLFINGLEAFVPHWKIIRINPANTDPGYCQMADETNQMFRDKCKKYPKEYGGSDECNRLMKPYAGFTCYNGDGESAVNSALSQVDSSIELLFVENGVYNQKINFNNLPSQMMVVLYYSPDNSKVLSIIDEMLKTNFDASPSSIQKLFKNIPKSSADVQIVGDIKNKVTSLSLTYQTFQVVESDLNVDNLILDTCTFDENSPKKIQSKYTLSHISNRIPDSVIQNLNQIGYFNDEDKSIDVKIELDVDEVHVTTSDSTNYVKYDFDKQLILILYATKINFTVSEAFGKINDKVLKLNLTLTNFRPSRRPSDDIKVGDWFTKSRLLAKESITINVEGNWSKVNKHEIILNYDKNQINVDYTELEKVAIVNETELYHFQSSWKDKKKKNVGLIVGVTVGCVAAVAIIIIVVILVIHYKNKNKASANESNN